MPGRRSRSAVLERSMAESSSKAVERAAETVSELAERAVVAAREAQRVATPALRSAAHTSAETLSHAAEKAAEVLAEAADRLSQEVAEMPQNAKGKRAAEAMAQAARPKKWRRRFRRMLVVTGVAGAAYVVVTKTPLKAKLSEMVFGPPLDDDEAEPITLPVTGSPTPGPAAEAEEASGETEKGEGDAPAKAKRASKSSAPQDDGASA